MSAAPTTGDLMPQAGPLRVSVGALLRWSAGAGDFSEIHHDDVAARDRGLDGAVVHGTLQVALMRELLLRWLGDQTRLLHLEATYRAAAPVEDPLTFGGGVVGVREGASGAEELACELWARRADGTVTVRAEASVHRTEDPTDALPLERLRRAVRLGEVAGSFTYRVQESDLERFARAHDREPDPSGQAPPTYFGALDPVERRDLDLDGFLQDLSLPQTGGGNAFNEVEYVRPLVAGDEITVTIRYTDVYEKAGSRGTLLFRVRENELHDTGGALVATTRCGHVLGFRLPGGDA